MVLNLIGRLINLGKSPRITCGSDFRSHLYFVKSTINMLLQHWRLCMAFTYLLIHLLLQGTSTYSTDRYYRVYKGIPLNTSKSGWRNINRQLYLKLIEITAGIEECKDYVHSERVTDRKARGLQKEEIACKCQTFYFISLKWQEETN